MKTNTAFCIRQSCYQIILEGDEHPLLKYFFVPVRRKYFLGNKKYEKYPEMPLCSRKGGILQIMGISGVILKEDKIYYAGFPK